MNYSEGRGEEDGGKFEMGVEEGEGKCALMRMRNSWVKAHN